MCHMSKKHASLDTAFALTLLASLMRNHNLPLSTMFKDPSMLRSGEDASFWRKRRLSERKHQKRGAHTMIPPDLILLLQQRRSQELVRQAELARLVRAGERKPENSQTLFPHLLWGVGGALVSRGCAVQKC